MLPVIPKALSFSLISDFGNVWEDGGEKMESIMTYGAEGRLSFGPLVLALGIESIIFLVI